MNITFAYNFFLAILAVEQYQISLRDYHANENLYYYFMTTDDRAAKEAHRNASLKAYRTSRHAAELIRTYLSVEPRTLID